MPLSSNNASLPPSISMASIRGQLKHTSRPLGIWKRGFAACILCGYQALHSKGFVYRDMKPANAFYDLSNKILQIMDFGISAIIRRRGFQQYSRDGIGTPAYMAPEIANGERHDRSVDIWQLAVMMVVVAARWNPFHDGVNIYAPVRAYQNPETFFKYLNTDECTSFWKLIQFFWKPIQNLETGQGVSQYFQTQFLIFY